MASTYSDDSYQTDNPFIDKLVKNLKILTYNTVIKDEQAANAAETEESLREAEVYFACIEGTATLGMFTDIPEQFMRQVGLPEDTITIYKNFNHLQRVIPTDNEETGTHYRKDLLALLIPWYVNNFDEKNEYYRRITGKPPRSEWGIPVRDYAMYLPESFTYHGEFVHEIGINAIRELDSYGVIEMMKNDYADKCDVRYLDYITHGIKLYDARKAYDFMILTTPNDVDQLIKETWERKYEDRRDFLLKSVYTSAMELENPHYHAFMQIYLLISVMVDMLTEVQSNIVKRDILDRRCIEYIFSMYGIPYYRDIPYKYQERMVYNLYNLIKYKSCSNELLEIAKIFGLDDVEFFKYYIFKERKRDEYGNFLWKADEVLTSNYNNVVGVNSIEELTTSESHSKGLPTEYKWYTEDMDEDTILRVLSYPEFDTTGNILSAQEFNKELEDDYTEEIGDNDPVFGDDYVDRYIPYPFHYYTQKGNITIVSVDNRILTEGVDYRRLGYDIIRFKKSIIDSGTKIRYDFYYDRDSRNDVFNGDTFHAINMYTYTTSYYPDNTIDLSLDSDVPAEFFKSTDDMLVLVGSIFLPKCLYHRVEDKVIIDPEVELNHRNVTLILLHSDYMRTAFDKKVITSPSDDADEFKIPEPFEYYVKSGNGFFVNIGTLFIDPLRYTVTYNDDGTANLKFIDGTTVRKGRSITFNFIYSLNTRARDLDIIYDIYTFKPTQNYQIEFPFTFPVSNYVGSDYKVYLNVFNTWLPPESYTCTNNSIIILDTGLAIKKTDTVKVVLAYHNADRTLPDNYCLSMDYTEDTATENHQRTFKFTAPVKNYVDKKNAVILDINNNPLIPGEYRIDWDDNEVNATVTLTTTSRDIKIGDILNVTFLYNGDVEYRTNVAIQQSPDTGAGADQLIPLMYPFFPYMETGHDFIVIYGGTVLDKSRYEIVDNFSLRLLDDTADSPKHGTITILYIYTNWYVENGNSFNLIHTTRKLDISDRKRAYEVKFPFDNYVTNNWPYFIEYGDRQLFPDKNIDLIDTTFSSYPPELLEEGYFGDSLTFHFIYLLRYPYVWKENREDYEYTTNLKFCKIPVHDYYSAHYLLDNTRWKDYDIQVHNDGWWAGLNYKENHYDTIKKEIYKSDFNYSRTKYYGVSKNIQITEYSAQLAYFYAALFDDVFLESNLNVNIPTLSSVHSFNVAHLILFMTCLTYTYNDMDDVEIEEPTVPIIASGFNFRADLDKIREFIKERHFDPEYFKIWNFIVPTEQITDLSEFVAILKNNLDVYYYIRNRIVKSNDFREYLIWEYIYKYLMTWNFNLEYYRLNDGTIPKTYTDFLKEKDDILYSRLVQIRSISDRETRIDAITTAVDDICYVLEEYISGELESSIFSGFAGYSTDAILKYMVKIIEFFKSYKIIFNERGEQVNIGGSGNRTMNEDGFINFYDQASFKEVNKVKDYIEIEEVVHTNCTSKVSEFEEENSQGNRWLKEDCQITTHHADGKEEIIDVQ